MDERIERTPSPWLAWLGAALGASSLATVFAPLNLALWTLPALGILASGYAVHRAHRSEEPRGGGWAWFGLGLSLFCGAAAVAGQQARAWWYQREAREFGAEWFQYVAHGEPHKAVNLFESVTERRPVDDQLWGYYQSGRRRARLLAVVQDPVWRTMLSLGTKAEVRFYEAETLAYDRRGEYTAELVYAVTYTLQGEKQTFFLALSMLRGVDDRGFGQWRMAGISAPHRPASWRER